MGLKFNKRFVIFLALVMMLSQQVTVSASETELSIYEAKLQQLNDELGTQYSLSPTDGSTYQEMVNYFTSMSLDEFEKYIREAYEIEKQSYAIEQQPMSDSSEEISLYLTLQQQKYYYNSSNYLYIKAYTTKVNGVTVYTGNISSTGYSTKNYPYYKVNTFSSSFSGDKRKVYCTFGCTKYIAKNLIVTTTYTLRCTFAAGGGNVYPVVEV